MGMREKQARVLSLFETALRKIRLRSVPEPNAWERYQLFEALLSLEHRDFDTAERALLHLDGTPEVKDISAIWEAARFTFADISVHFKKVQAQLAL